MSIRAKRLSRAKIKQSGRYSVRLFLSNKHIYASIVDPNGKTLTTVSTLSKSVASKKVQLGKSHVNIKIAELVGTELGKAIVELKIKDQIAFDRSGFVVNLLPAHEHRLNIKFFFDPRCKGCNFGKFPPLPSRTAERMKYGIFPI